MYKERAQVEKSNLWILVFKTRVEILQLRKIFLTEMFFFSISPIIILISNFSILLVRWRVFVLKIKKSFTIISI